MKKIIAFLIAFFPNNKVRILMWRTFLKYRIDYKSKISWGNIINCESVNINNAKIGRLNRIRTRIFIMENQSEIRNLNNIKFINEFKMKENSQIISRNGFVGFDFLEKGKENRDSIFEIGKTSLITINHLIDVTNKVIIGDNVVFGGQHTQLWTHGFDIYRNMISKPIIIGNDIYIGSMSLICQGVNICDKTVVGAGTCVSSSISESGFYVSNMLIRKGDIKNY